ncbi:MAG: metal-dependent transcriptional regulator [Candidatus Latescibacterota bacterium]|nr:MAG: metal-dependent transcriptional regulator [Candidatus Latescibacterota bacterium]
MPKLSDKLEMYLKTILLLEREYKPVRVSHIAKMRGVSAASVTEAIHTLQDRGLILHRAYGGVRLSAKGRRKARQIEGYHDVLRHFLTDILGVGEPLATGDACEIEHVASAETMERLTAMLEYLDQSDVDVSRLIAGFQKFYSRREEVKLPDAAESDKGGKKPQ